MAEKLNKRLIVSIGGAVVLIAAIGGLYMMFLRPQMKEWNKVNRLKKERATELARLKKAFGKQNDPKIILKALRQEISNLGKANRALSRIKRPGTEMKDLPDELKDPDPQIRKALFDEYNSMLMKSEQESIEAALKEAKIEPPDFSLHSNLKGTHEVPYYINRKTGLQGIINALIKTQAASNDKILFQELGLENYAKGLNRRRASINVLSYFMQMTMDMDNLTSFLYNLNEEEGYYYVEEMTIKPATRQRFGGRDAKLLVDARINTILIYQSEVAKDLRMAVEKSAKQSTARVSKSGKVGGFLSLASGTARTAERELERQKNKKWYEFWK
jgi:hypothetical protein